MNGSNREEVKIMVIKITPKQSKQINALIKKLCCNYVDGSCFCWTTAKNTPVCSASAGMESTATISKTQSFQQTASCLPRSCSQTIKRDVKSASRISYQVQKTSATAKLCCRPKAEESRRAPAQETGGASLIRFQDGVLTSDTVL